MHLDRFAGAAKSGLMAWLSVLVRSIARRSLTKQEKELITALRKATKAIAPPILGAVDRADLESRIRAAVASPELLRFNAEITGLVTLDQFSEATHFPAEPPKELGAVLGEGPAKKLLASGPLMAAVASAFVQLVAELAGRHPGDVVLKDSAAYSDRYFADPTIPSAVKRCVLRGQESFAALLAITHALFLKRRLDAWLALALVETHQQGLYELLRLLASAPSIRVPETIIPQDARLDLTALDRQVRSAHAHWDQLAEAALAHGGTLGDGDEDDP